MVELTEKTLAHLCLAASAKYKEKPAFALISDGNISRQITYTQMGIYTKKVSLFLKQLGVKKNDKVMLLSENMPEWPLAYFSIALAGAVSVPLLTGFSPEQIVNITNHAGISAICLSRAVSSKIENTQAVQALSKIPFIYIDSLTGDEDDLKISVSQNGEEKQINLHFDNESEVAPPNKADELATIIYTSGTQGNNKGVMLSGTNMVSCAISTLDFAKIKSHDRLVSILPLAHAYECSLGFLAPVVSGASITYLDKPPSPSVLLEAVKVIRPTIMASVPLFIEKIYRNAIKPKLEENKLYKFPITRLLAVRVAGRKLISTLGGRIKFFGVGGAPLSAEVEKFLHRARFPYTIGYGLTEASPLVAGNIPFRFPVFSGLLAPNGVKFRIANCNEETGDGEIQVSGPNVMMGYYKDEERTAEAFTSDGWLRTGDLGRLDSKGRVQIRGRLKTLILGPAGENIYPEEIEGLLNTSQLVEDALVYSGEKGELVALVKLNDAAKAAAGAVEQALEELKVWVNKKLAAFSRLSRIEIRYEPFEKTPTMKIKRYLYVLKPSN